MVRFNSGNNMVPIGTKIKVIYDGGSEQICIPEQCNWNMVDEFEVLESSCWCDWSESHCPVHPDVYVQIAVGSGHVNVGNVTKASDVDWADHEARGSKVQFRVVPDPVEEKKPDPVFDYIKMVEKDLEFVNGQEKEWMIKLEQAKEQLHHWQTQQTAIRHVHGRLISGGMNGVEIKDE